MSLDSRIGWLLLGCAIGFILGYLVKSIGETKARVEEVEKIVKQKRPRNDDGFARLPALRDIMLLIVVLLTAFAALQSQRSSNKSNDTQASYQKQVTCNQEYLAKTITALNARTQFTQEQANANVELQKAQATFLSLLLEKPPPTQEVASASVETYVTALNNFVTVQSKTSNTTANNPYPTISDFTDCLHRK